MFVIGQRFLNHLPITSNLFHKTNISRMTLLVIGNNPIKLGSLRILGNIGTQYTTEDGWENGSNED